VLDSGKHVYPILIFSSVYPFGYRRYDMQHSQENDTLQNDTQHNKTRKHDAQPGSAKCHRLNTVMLSDILLNVIAP